MEKDHLEILLEDISGKFDILIEGHAALNDKMDGMRTELTEKIDQVDFKVEVVNKRVDALDRKVDALDRKVDALAADLAAHRSDTEAHHGVYCVKESGE